MRRSRSEPGRYLGHEFVTEPPQSYSYLAGHDPTTSAAKARRESTESDRFQHTNIIRTDVVKPLEDAGMSSQKYNVKLL